jgi:8-oxo-dGTP diphosphatase
MGERRSDGSRPLALPGGKPEAGETMEACAIRELAEETGLVMREETVRTYACTLIPGVPHGWVLVGVTGEIDAPAAEIRPQELESEKNGAYRWVDPDNLPAGLYPPSTTLLSLYAVGRAAEPARDK